MCVGRPSRPQVQGLTAEEKAEQEQAKEREKQAREEAEAQERRRACKNTRRTFRKNGKATTPWHWCNLFAYRRQRRHGLF